MRISPIVNTKIYNNGLSSDFNYSKSKLENKSPAFKGLTKCLKNKIYLDGQKDIELLLRRKPNTNPIVGQLPNFIFKIDGQVIGGENNEALTMVIIIVVVISLVLIASVSAVIIIKKRR